MFHFRLWILAVLRVSASLTNKAACLSVAASTVSQPSGITTSLITDGPSLRVEKDLKKRKQSSVYVCGYDNEGLYYGCLEHDEWCVGTVLSNGKGYAYCSTYQVVDQDIKTTAVENWKGDCPKSTSCCYAENKDRYILTALLFVSDYSFTITDWFCTDKPSHTRRYHPVQRVLDPTSISSALASLAEATGTDSKLSSSEQIGIGIGIGVGGLVLILGALILFWRQRRIRRGQYQRPEIQPQSPQEDFSYLKRDTSPHTKPIELPSHQPQEMFSAWNTPELTSSEFSSGPRAGKDGFKQGARW